MAADAASSTHDPLLTGSRPAQDVSSNAPMVSAGDGTIAGLVENAAGEADVMPSALAPPTMPPRARRTQLRKRWIIGVSCLVAVVGTIGITGFVLAHRAPTWWATIDTNDPRAIERAQIIENGAATQLTKIRQSDPAADVQSSVPWTVSISANDANAWLATRLPKWLESQAAEAKQAGRKPFTWPKDLGQVQVRFADGAIWVGASVKPKGLGQSQIVSASLEPVLRDDGSLWFPARLVSLGQLNLPASWMLSAGAGDAKSKVRIAKVPKNLRDLPQTKDVLNILTGQSPAMRRPIIKIGDGRRVKLLNIESRDGVLLITCQTMGREKK